MVNILDKINKLANKYNTEIYLTGGAVRDILLGIEVNDFDFTVKDDAEKMSIEFSNIISGTHIFLDKKNKIYRVVKNRVEYDFTALQGKNIKEDLIRRDFTINSLAVHHQNFDKIKKYILNTKNSNNFDKSILIDPVRGVNDLDASLIRVIGDKTFDNDPIRLLRAVRFKAVLDFDIEKSTEKMIFKKRNLINDSASERIRYELQKIFETKNTAEIVNYVENNLRLFSILFSEIIDWNHVIDILNLYKKFLQGKIINYLPTPEKRALMKFAILFHECDNEYLKKIFTKVKFSNKEIKYIEILVSYYKQVFCLYNDKNLNNSKIYDFFEEVENFAPDILFLSALDYSSTKKNEYDYQKRHKFWKFINKLLEKYENIIKDIKNPLLNGKEIMDILNIKESPLVGEYLRKLRKRQALGKIDKKSEAVNFIKNLEINAKNNN